MKKTILIALVAAPLSLSSAHALAAADAATVRSFNSKCGACHGSDGKGATKQGQKMKVGDMTSAAWQKEFTDEKIKETITNGFTREKDGVKQEMKGQKDKLTPEQIDALAKYVRELKK